MRFIALCSLFVAQRSAFKAAAFAVDVHMCEREHDTPSSVESPGSGIATERSVLWEVRRSLQTRRFQAVSFCDTASALFRLQVSGENHGRRLRVRREGDTVHL